LILRDKDYVKLDLACLSIILWGCNAHRPPRGGKPDARAGNVSPSWSAPPTLSGTRRAVRVNLAGRLTLFREGEALYVATPNAGLPFDHWPQMPAQIDRMVSLCQEGSSFGRLEFFGREMAACRPGVGTSLSK